MGIVVMAYFAKRDAGSAAAPLLATFSKDVCASVAVLLLLGSVNAHAAFDGSAPPIPSAAMATGVKESAATAPVTRYERVAQVVGARADVRQVLLEAGKPSALPLPPLGGKAVDYSFLRVRGLPPGFKLSAGFATKDAWLVSLNDAAGLKLMPSANFQGEALLEFLLVQGTDTSRLAVVKISTGAGNSSQINTSTQPVPGAVEQAPTPQILPEQPKRTITPEAEDSGLKRAELLLKSSDIAAARMVYETMALKGSAKAALAMGQTFDPNFLALFPLQGLKPDPTQAKSWYRKAIALGETRAQERLSDLGQ